MPMSAKTLEDMLRSAFPDAVIRVQDLRGDGDHYAAQISSAAFQGKTRVEQHKMVYAALGGQMGETEGLHALALTTTAG